MFATLGWVLLAGPPLSSPVTNDVADTAPARPHVAAGRVAVWADRDDPYDRGDGARVYLTAQQPAHVAVFRVDTDGRIRVLFPREPWGDTWVRDSRRLEVPGGGFQCEVGAHWSEDDARGLCHGLRMTDRPA